MTATTDRSKVFVIHGRDSHARDGLYDLLSSVGLHPLEWNEILNMTGEGTPYIGAVIEKGFEVAQAVIVLMTPDDEARLRSPLHARDERQEETELRGQPRPNVLLEAGMALALHPSRTIIVQMGSLRGLSDINGRHLVRLDNSPERRQELLNRLMAAKCKLDMGGVRWQRAGDLSITTMAAPDDRTDINRVPIDERQLYARLKGVVDAIIPKEPESLAGPSLVDSYNKVRARTLAALPPDEVDDFQYFFEALDAIRLDHDSENIFQVAEAGSRATTLLKQLSGWLGSHIPEH